jgi:hypothetical protein
MVHMRHVWELVVGGGGEGCVCVGQAPGPLRGQLYLVLALWSVQMWLCHKLRGELVTRADPRGRPTVFHRLVKMDVPGASGLVPVGRLEYAAEGLLLLTNSGGWLGAFGLFVVASLGVVTAPPSGHHRRHHK